MAKPPTENGCYLLFRRDGRKLAGYVRIESTAGIARLEVEVPASQQQARYLAILAPDSVERCVPCEPEEAELFVAALRHDFPNWAPDYDIAVLRPDLPSPN
jgi:hypothetical protein